jgi:hypothetical protein
LIDPPDALQRSDLEGVLRGGPLLENHHGKLVSGSGDVCTGYAVLWNAFMRITAGCSQSEKLALYSGTAKRLYHLD